MNFLKNLLVNDLPHHVEQPVLPFQKSHRITQGICLTCSNRPHCVWQENNKQLCEHFD